MPYFYLTICVFAVSSSSILGKLFSRRHEDLKTPTNGYHLLQLTSALVVWGIIYAFDASFSVGVLLYSFLFALCFVVANRALLQALKRGPATLTALFNSMSLIATTIWGFFFWDTKPTLFVISGLCIVAVAIFLCLYKKGDNEKSFSWKWLIFALLSFAGNAGCSIVQRTQQMQFQGAHGKMMMVFAMLFATLFFLVCYLRGDQQENRIVCKKSWYIPMSAGACNAILNFFVILLIFSPLSSSLIYPVMSIGGLSIVAIVSRFIFKEKLKKQQWLGILLGAIATGLLSI